MLMVCRTGRGKLAVLRRLARTRRCVPGRPSGRHGPAHRGIGRRRRLARGVTGLSRRARLLAGGGVTLALLGLAGGGSCCKPYNRRAHRQPTTSSTASAMINPEMEKPLLSSVGKSVEVAIGPGVVARGEGESDGAAVALSYSVWVMNVISSYLTYAVESSLNLTRYQRVPSLSR